MTNEHAAEQVVEYRVTYRGGHCGIVGTLAAAQAYITMGIGAGNQADKYEIERRTVTVTPWAAATPVGEMADVAADVAEGLADGLYNPGELEMLTDEFGAGFGHRGMTVWVDAWPDMGQIMVSPHPDGANAPTADCLTFPIPANLADAVRATLDAVRP